MGKTKKPRASKAARLTGLTAMAEPDAEGGETFCGTGSTVAGLIEKLQYDTVEGRECACTTISHLVNDPEAMKQVIQGDVLRIMAPLMLDVNRGVRKAALGALRNITVDGGPGICEIVVHQDCMTPLIALLQQFVPSEACAAVLDDATDRDILLQAVHLLWNLCESSSTAVKLFNQHSLAGLLLRFSNPDHVGYPLTLAVAWCLYTVTENNPDLGATLREEQVMAQLFATMNSRVHLPHAMLLRTLAAGILQNISQNQEEVITSAAELFSQVLDEDIAPRLETIAQSAASLPSPSHCGNGSPSEIEVKSDKLEALLAEIDSLINAQQLTLELITNVASGIDDEDEWEDVSSDNSSDEASESSRIIGPSDVEISMDTGNEEEVSVNLPSAVKEAFIKFHVLTKAMTKSKLPSPELMQMIKEHRKTSKLWRGLIELQSRSLLCMSNIVNTVDLLDIGGPTFVSELWSHLSRLLADSQALGNLDQLESVTCALRSVAQKMISLHSQQMQQQVNESDLQFLCHLVSSCPHPSVRANIVRILASIGVALVSDTSQVNPLLKPIGELLCGVVSSDDSLLVVAEAIDSLMDVFAEDHTDPLLKELDVISKLNALLPQLKAKVKKQRRELGEHAVLVNTVRANLPRFIQYKTQSLQAKR